MITLKIDEDLTLNFDDKKGILLVVEIVTATLWNGTELLLDKRVFNGRGRYVTRYSEDFNRTLKIQMLQLYMCTVCVQVVIC